MIVTLPARQRQGSSAVAGGSRRPGIFRVLIVFAIVVVGAAVTAVPESAFTAQNKTVWDGIYTEEQAERGARSFTTYCVRCHGGAANDGEEGRSLAGEPFWKSFRESTVDHLLDYVSRNMPNGAGGTLGANVYADVVAFILSRNALPPGTSELTKDSAVGVQIIAKGGPGELPDGTLVRVLGCLAAREGGGWILNAATAPERTNSIEGADDKTRPLGTRSYRLMYVITPLQRFVGHRMSIRGLLIGDGGRDGINVSMTQSLAESCQ
jgi:S-disulfanyl-L-cysteine oxidoreductase SoxD